MRLDIDEAHIAFSRSSIGHGQRLRAQGNALDTRFLGSMTAVRGEGEAAAGAVSARAWRLSCSPSAAAVRLFAPDRCLSDDRGAPKPDHDCEERKGTDKTAVYTWTSSPRSTATAPTPRAPTEAATGANRPELLDTRSWPRASPTRPTTSSRCDDLTRAVGLPGNPGPRLPAPSPTRGSPGQPTTPTRRAERIRCPAVLGTGLASTANRWGAKVFFAIAPRCPRPTCLGLSPSSGVGNRGR